jgi:hypothetical protein
MKPLLLRFLFLLLAASPIILLVWLAIFFKRLERSSIKQKPRQEGSAVEFFLVPRMRILIGLALVALTAFTFLVVAESIHHGGGWYVVLIPLSVVAAILLAKPRAVLLDHNGIRQRRWIRGDREVAWDEIAWMRRGQNTGTTYVKSKKGGRPISFSPPARRPVPFRTRGSSTC